MRDLEQYLPSFKKEKYLRGRSGYNTESESVTIEAIERAIKAETKVARLKEEAHQDIEWLYKEYVLEADVNLSQDAIDLKRKLRDMVCKELQAENARLRKVLCIAQEVVNSNRGGLVPGYKFSKLEQALAKLDKEES